MTESEQTDSLWENFKQIVIVVVMFVVVTTSIVQAYKIPSQSMEDTLLIGDFLLANKFVYGARLPLVNWRLPAIAKPQRGDVVIFVFPRDGKTKYIKRCVAVPGDVVEVRDKVLYVNGQQVAMPPHGKFIDTVNGGLGHPREMGLDSRDNYGPYEVPQDCYFMMGDNRDNSFDSRFWGVVPYDYILGEAILIHWSWDDSGAPSPGVTASDPLSVPRMFIHNAVHFFEKVRWNRLFRIIS